MEDFKSLFSLAEYLPEMPGNNSLPVTESLRDMRVRLAVEKSIHDNPGDESAQIDAIATARCYFRGCGRAVDIVNSYVNGTIDVRQTVRRIAEPIEYAYTTADGGRRFVSEELCARSQRSYHKPEMALELWGPEEDLNELQARMTDPDDAPTVEGELWDLYYTILHAARKTPWRDEGAQQKLVDLVVAFKTRPDPEFPSNMTTALKKNWIYEWGRLWSNAIMLGPSARESWNDQPGCGAGWYPPEVSAWANVNAFVARLTAQGVHDFHLYSLWALESALDVKIDIHPHSRTPASSEAVKAECLFEVARIWIRLAGQSIFQGLSSGTESNEKSKWHKWQQRFEEEAAKGQYSPTVTAVAEECAELMSQISEQTQQSQLNSI